MEEVIACRNDTPDNLLFVAGGGAWVDKSSIMWRIFMKEAKALGLSFSTVDGIHKEKKGGGVIYYATESAARGHLRGDW